MFGSQKFVTNIFSYCLDGPFGPGFNLWLNGSSATIFSQVKTQSIYFVPIFKSFLSLCIIEKHLVITFLIQSSRCWTSSYIITMECESSRNNPCMYNIRTRIFHELYEKFLQKINFFGSFHDSSICELIPCAFCKNISIVNAL